MEFEEEIKEKRDLIRFIFLTVGILIIGIYNTIERSSILDTNTYFVIFIIFSVSYYISVPYLIRNCVTLTTPENKSHSSVYYFIYFMIIYYILFVPFFISTIYLGILISFTNKYFTDMIMTYPFNILIYIFVFTLIIMLIPNNYKNNFNEKLIFILKFIYYNIRKYAHKT